MGREIVYCEGCGHNLREDDFDRGRARRIDNKPFCTDCRPFRSGEEQGRRGSSSRGLTPAAPPRKTSTGAIPIIPGPRRSSGASEGSNPLPVIAGVGGVLLVVLIFAVTQGGSKKSPVIEVAPPPLVEIPVARRVAPPAPPSGPLVAPTASEKLDAFIAQIRGMIQSDDRQERTEEILRMFAAAANSAGPRAGEVAKMRSEYVGTLNETTRRAAAWGEWRITSNAEAGMTALLVSYQNRDNVYQTHPLDRTVPAKLERDLDVPSGKKTQFSFWVACHEKGDFELRVFVDNKPVMKETIGPPGSGWRQRKLDLTPYAGKKIALRVENFPNDWSWEYGYWSDFVIASE